MKVVIPSAGLGERLLPTTKAIPKALWPINNKPAIQWALEEVIAAQLSECIIIIQSKNSLIRKYLSPLPTSDPRSSHSTMKSLDAILNQLDINYVYQNRPQGLGHALLLAREMIGDSPFVLMLPDNIWTNGFCPTAQLCKTYHQYRSACVAISAQSKQTTTFSSYYGVPLAPDIVEVLSLGVPPQIENTGCYEGIGRAIWPSQALDCLVKTWSVNKIDLDERVVLNALIEDNQLLGVILDPPCFHLGSS